MGWLIEDYPETVVCCWCHRDFTIGRKRLIRVKVSWQAAVRFCPYCGHLLGGTEEDMVQQGYEKVEHA